MADEPISRVSARQRSLAALAERRSVILPHESGEITDAAQDAASDGNRGSPGVLPVIVYSEIARRRRLFDLHATLDPNYTPR